MTRRPVGFIAAARARVRGRAKGQDDRGDTLVELLSTLTVLGLAGVALVTAFGTTIEASSEHRQLTNIDAVMRSVVESATAQLQQQPAPYYQSCGSITYYNSLLANSSTANSVLALNLPSGYTDTVTGVSYWNGAAFSSSYCIAGSTAPELLTLEVSKGSYDDSISFAIDDRGLVGQATTALDHPQITSLTPSLSTPGALTISYTGSDNAPVGQTYVAEACLDSLMTNGCVSRNPFMSGADVTGLTQGATYYVELIASASTGYSPATSALDGPVVATTQLDAPSAVTLSAVTSTSLRVAFTASDNAPPGQTYSALLCTNTAMTTGCVGPTTVTSPTTITGLTVGATYYATITSAASTGYLAVTSVASNGAATTVQLATPVVTNVAVGAGGLAVTFTGSSNAPGGQTYTAVLCTNSAMTTGCASAVISSGGVVTGLVAGASYYATVSANASPGYLSATSSVTTSAVAFITQLAAPTGVTLGHGAVAGSLTVNFTGSSNAATGQTYTAVLCTNSAMTTGCTSAASITSGGQVTGLAPGTTYFVTVTATASTGYLAATSSASSGLAATVQLNAPTAVVLSAGTANGSLSVTFTGSSNAPTGQLYSVIFCTNAAMTTGCTVPTALTSGTSVSGLVAGTIYYATVAATASPGFLVSPASGASSGLAATFQLSAPTGVTLGHGTVAGSLVVTFTGSSNAATGQLYTVVLCTNAGMTTGCTSATPITSGGQVTGLTPGITYYATVTALASTGYLAATSSASSGLAATVQLSAPTSVTLGYGTVAGSLTISFTPPGNAATGQLYTTVLCTNLGMTTGCTTAASITSGGQVTGLVAGTVYYATVTASASGGFLVSPTSGVSSGLAASVQLSAPTVVTLGHGTVAGSLSVTFIGSSNAAAGQLYTVIFCTNLAMTTGCTTAASIATGGQVTGLTPGTTYYATVTAVASGGYLAATSSASSGLAATVQLSAPTVVILGHGTVAGSLTMNFTPPANAATGQLYTTILCTNSAMTTGCTTAASITSGGQVTGLTPGTTYYATVTAVASGGYLVSPASSASGGLAATVQLASPTSVTLSLGSVSGSLAFTFSAPANAATGQLYTTVLCTNSAMTTGCTTATAITNGGQVTGLTPGTTYFATVTASASGGYLVSPASIASSGVVAPAQVATPVISSVVAPSGAGGRLTITFTEGGTVTPTSYTATLCTNSAMTTGCVIVTGYVSGVKVTGLVTATVYYVTITALAPAGDLNSTTAAYGPTTSS